MSKHQSMTSSTDKYCIGLRPALGLCVATSLLLVFTLSPRTAAAQGQSGRATITGRVADSTGASIPDAALELVSTQTGEKRSLKSDGAGLYSFPSLSVGIYKLTVMAPNFARSTYDNLELTVGQTAEINVLLKPAGTTNTVDVSAEDTDLTNRSAADNTSILNNDLVEDLPTRGRNFTDFALLTPGISQELDRFGLVVNGQRSGNSNISIDGVDFNDPLQNGQRGGPVAVYFFPKVAVLQFAVTRTGLGAEVGRTNAGFVNVVTKSGTNRFHGEAVYSNRNPFLTWPDALNDPEATNNQNQFGIGIGGPIFKDKLFFFAGVEKTDFQVPYFVRFNNCPTAGYYDPTGLNPGCTQAAIQLTNPGTTPQPLPASITSLEVPSYGFNSPLATSARLDWQVNPHNTAMLQYMSTFLSNVAFGSSGVQSAAASTNTLYSQQSQAVIVGLTTVLSSSLTNDAHLQAVYDNRQQNPVSSGPQIDISDLGTLGGNADGANIYRAVREEAIDNVNWLLGKNSLHFGVDLNIEPETQQREANANGDWIIDTFQDYLKVLPTSQGGGGVSAASLNAAGCGAVSNACAIQFIQTLPLGGGNRKRYTGTQQEYAGYVQDTFHVLPTLTLNAGLRYEAQLEPKATANPAVPGTGVSPSDVTMFQPRVGLAWDLRGDGKTVFRASSGLYDARTPAYILARNFTDNGLYNAVVNTNYDQSVLSNPALQNYGSLSAVPTQSILNDIYTNSPDFKNPRSFQAAAAIERQLTKRTALVVVFTQNETWKLHHRLNTNLYAPTVDAATFYPVFPSIIPGTSTPCTYQGVPTPCRPNTSINTYNQNFSTAHSTYRGLSVQVKGNVTKRLQGVANFTWASSRDDDSNERDFSRELALDPLCTACYNRGYSKQDIRDQFNLAATYRLPLRFTFSTSFIARTALPYSAITSGSKQGDFNNDGDTANDRPILCSQVRFTVCAINPNAVNAYKGAAAVGTVAGRNTFRQDGFLNWDMRLIRAFRFGHKQEIQASVECLNCSRSSNLNLGANEVSKFTHSQGTLNPITGYYYSGNNAGFMLNAFDTFRSGGPRQIQLGAKYKF